MERSADWLDQAQAVFQRLGAEVWGHSVADLLEELAQHTGEAAAYRDMALELDKAYIPL